MKLMLIVVDEARKEELEVVLRASGIAGFTELAPAVGLGATGPRLGSGAFPRTSAVVFSLVEGSEVGRLAERLRAYCAECGERLKMVAWDVEEVL